VAVPDPAIAFRTLCESLFGRPNLRGDAAWPSSSFGLALILSDLALIQRPWWRVCQHAGLFFFRAHVLVNPVKARYSLGDEQSQFVQSLMSEGFTPTEISPDLRTALLRILGPRESIEDWRLLEIPRENQDSRELLDLLALTKCPSVESFDAIDPVTLQLTNRRKLDQTETIVHCDVPPAENHSDWLEICRHPGQFYRSLVPPRTSDEPLCWLFRSPATPPA
jgi:hypothetical protein